MKYRIEAIEAAGYDTAVYLLSDVIDSVCNEGYSVSRIEIVVSFEK